LWPTESINSAMVGAPVLAAGTSAAFPVPVPPASGCLIAVAPAEAGAAVGAASCAWARHGAISIARIMLTMIILLDFGDIVRCLLLHFLMHISRLMPKIMPEAN
jgi:hypothetical protein